MKKGSDAKLLAILKKIESQLKLLNEKVDLIVEAKSENLDKPRIQEGSLEKFNLPLDVVALLALPDHLRKTAVVMCDIQEATAEMVSEKTGRKRATESACLNQLVRMGYLRKKRRGLDVFFFFEE